MGANPHNGIKGIRDILDLNAVAMQLPIGLEENHVGVVDLVTMKAIYFDGDHGDDIRIEEIPEGMQADADSYRAEMLEAVSMFDDQMMEDLLEEKEISEEAIHAAVKIGVQTLEFCPVYMGSAFKNKGVQTLLDAVNRYLPSPLEAASTKATDVKHNFVFEPLLPEEDWDLSLDDGMKEFGNEFGSDDEVDLGDINTRMDVYGITDDDI